MRHVAINAQPSKPLVVPAAVLAALQIRAGDAVQWQVKNGEAVLRPDGPRRGVDEVAGMLAGKLKGKRIRWSAASASALEAWGQVR
jgi:antitoxin component of MazEF toxin-antitoxin module